MRHELKYCISARDIPAIQSALSRIMRADVHADKYGGYQIRSLYFDDEYQRAYHDKVAGIRDRDKYRIRLYNGDRSNIFIERKRKFGDVVEKSSAKISDALALRLMNADRTGLEKSRNKLLTDVYCKMTLDRLRPIVIVDYYRQAFTHPGGNTRVTIDRRVRSGLENTDIFDGDMLTVDAMDPAQAILEVKYDEMLPDFISSVISGFSGVRSALSKYIMCARYVI